MSDRSDLERRIAALQGRINKHKHNPTPHRGGHSFAQHAHRGNARWHPFGRGGFVGHQQPHRNRSLVLGNGQHGGVLDGKPATAAAELSTPADRQITETKPLVSQVAQEKNSLQQHPRTPTQQSPAPVHIHKPAKPINTTAKQTRELMINGIRFQVLDDGSKLIRIADSETVNRETPKTAKVADVQFLRTKHGNLIRAARTKDNQRYRGNSGPYSEDLDSTERRYRPAKRAPQCENFTRHGTISLHHPHTGYAQAKTLRGPHRIKHAGKLPRSRLTTITGTCTFGPACRFTHDPTKVAICKDFLHKGSCKAGPNCDLSHQPSYHRAPACTHFLRGNCTNNACRYPHINVSPAASVCRPFATLGFCAKGEKCDKRHVFECPDYANHGRCVNRDKGVCSLPHVDRAAALRKAAQRQAKTGSEDESDVSSSEDEDEEADIDSDVAEDIAMVDDDSHELSQQQDFIAFS